ncbi:uncharacterized protein PITG_11843 [Phytophthora infestans T30-4]|uniref:Uncharacterized protein n=1 Tax=Phytophthora infestans (strain T30-4) TaxID=403677 RepID=D0NHY2_PHYIT|nr:uncharacterized protein PITG_11843 [Phytophthora infestans T30-4]EEY58857.1 hypothetical protein PITG_11843 [Phytophthora infestans T30-4]|eukprot:XP_002901330.1 hypothetical protein PITG_11843 [Phytophthora infestans T30-4]
MVAFPWWDIEPVLYLCSVSAITASTFNWNVKQIVSITAITASTINWNVKQIGSITATCPGVVNDYQHWIGVRAPNLNLVYQVL